MLNVTKFVHRNPRSLRPLKYPEVHKDSQARSLRCGTPFHRSLRLRRHNPRSKPPPNRHQARPYPAHRQVHLQFHTRRPRGSRLEASTHKAYPEPQSGEELVQRVQLQQVPSLAAHRLRQDHIHRFRHHRLT